LFRLPRLLQYCCDDSWGEPEDFGEVCQYILQAGKCQVLAQVCLQKHTRRADVRDAQCLGDVPCFFIIDDEQELAARRKRERFGFAIIEAGCAQQPYGELLFSGSGTHDLQR
jgi:hypothetical protein